MIDRFLDDRLAPAGASIDCFPSDYSDARDRLLRLAPAAGGTLTAYVAPGAGPNGETLATDVAWFGDDDADHVLVLVSATHGVEGFCGSGVQLDWLQAAAALHQAALPDGVAMLLVHAINPHGYAWLRRTTEEGVDLNRNCVGFAPPPANAAYAELADAFVPPDLRSETLADADQLLARWRAEHGDVAFEHARSGGQHSHPDGIFYGGLEPTWSARTLGDLCRRFRLAERRGVAVIDFHTGLGPHGYGEPICGHKPGESGQARCRLWYGDSLGEPLLGTSSSLPIAGLTQYAWRDHVGADVLTFVALEFGTYPSRRGALALRADHVLHRAGAIDVHDPTAQAIKAELRKFYYPDITAWKEMVIMRSRQVIAQALAGLPGNYADGHPAGRR